jgi:hypothetical protein
VDDWLEKPRTQVPMHLHGSTDYRMGLLVRRDRAGRSNLRHRRNLWAAETDTTILILRTGADSFERVSSGRRGGR